MIEIGSSSKDLIMDRLTVPPLAWYGPRYVTKKYKGPIWRARRVTGGTWRDVYDDGQGLVDKKELMAIMGTDSIEVTPYDLMGGGPRPGDFFAMTSADGFAPQVGSNGVLNTVADIPAMKATANSYLLSNAQFGFNFTNTIIMNAVVVRGSTPSVAGYIFGADFATSGFSDLELFFPANSQKMGFGEDRSNYASADVGTLTNDTVSVFTAIRNGGGTNPPGFLKQNGQVIASYTSAPAGSQQPNRLAAFCDPDGGVGGYNARGAFMGGSSGSALMEFGIWNAAQSPSPQCLIDLELDQGKYFNIPIYGTLAWPVSVSRNILAANGSALLTNTGGALTYK